MLLEQKFEVLQIKCCVTKKEVIDMVVSVELKMRTLDPRRQGVDGRRRRRDQRSTYQQMKAENILGAMVANCCFGLFQGSMVR